MKPLLIATAVLAIQLLFFGGYFVLSTIMRRRGAILMLSWLAGTVVVSLFAFAAVKSVCHECLTVPMAAVCERSSDQVDAHDQVDARIESNTSYAGGYIKQRHYLGCDFYWHENNQT